MHLYVFLQVANPENVEQIPFEEPDKTADGKNRFFKK